MSLVTYPSAPAPSEQVHAHRVGEVYLRVSIDEQTQVAFPMASLQEVAVVTHQRITPIPNMPAPVLGLVSQRGLVFWIVDIANMLQLRPLASNIQNYTIAVVRTDLDSPQATPSPNSRDQQLLGLAVHAVQGKMRVPKDVIQSPLGHFPSELTPYLKGCVFQDQELVWLLDSTAIAQSQKLYHL